MLITEYYISLLLFDPMSVYSMCLDKRESDRPAAIQVSFQLSISRELKAVTGKESHPWICKKFWSAPHIPLLTVRQRKSFHCLHSKLGWPRDRDGSSHPARILSHPTEIWSHLIPWKKNLVPSRSCGMLGWDCDEMGHPIPCQEMLLFYISKSILEIFNCWIAHSIALNELILMVYMSRLQHW